jgi:glucose-6-phosphate 1-dehydrogenase
MSAPQSDALVFFWATGDLTYRKVFPSLQDGGHGRVRAGAHRRDGR